MRALLYRECRELLPNVATALGIAVAVGLLDMVYNWGEADSGDLSISFCSLLAVAVALHGGASAIARDSDEATVFAASFPVSRSQLWLAKLLANMGAVIVAAVPSFALCAGLAVLGGHESSEAVTASLPRAIVVLTVVVLGVFASGFMASGIARSPRGAAVLVAPVLFALSVGSLRLSLGISHEGWWPWLGAGWDALSSPEQAAVALTAGLLLAATALAAGYWGFVGHPVLEARRRAVSTLGALFALVALLVVAAAAGAALAFRG